MNDVTNHCAAFAANLCLEDLPGPVREHAKTLLLDAIGAAIRARHDAESTPPMMRALESLGLSRGSCSVFGDRATYAPAGAALANSALAASVDSDDMHAQASVHVTAPILGAALAAAELAGAKGEDLIVGMVAGYELACRLSRAVDPAGHYDRGFHPSATCGTFAAAAAAGRILGLKADRMSDAFGIALSQAAGSMQYLANGAYTKRFQTGHAAMAGLTAAMLAREGYRGASEAIEGRYGFLNAYSANPNPSLAVLGLGDEWETVAVALKPYPACRYTHACLDAAIDIVQRHRIDAAQIRSVDVGLSSKGIDLTASPEHQKRHPTSLVDGRYSVHFVVAVALREGRIGWDTYRKHLCDPATRDLQSKIAAIRDPEVERAYPSYLSGSVRVVMEDGVTHEAFVKVPKGERENPMSAEEIRSKFGSLVGPFIGKAAELALWRTVSDLENGTVSEIYRHATPALPMAAAGDD